MNRRTWILPGILVLVIAAMAGLWSQELLAGEPPQANESDEHESDEEADDDWPFGGEEDESDRGSGPRRSGGGSRGWGERRLRGSHVRAPDARPKASIVALGARPPRFDAEAIIRAMEPGQEAQDACVERAGGSQAARIAMVSTIFEARRLRRTVSFDVRRDGTVVPASIVMDPPVPAPFDVCMHDFVASARIPNAGDGAHVHMRFGPRTYRHAPDAGMP